MRNGFSHNPFMMGYNNEIFEEDEELGFKFPNGKLITSMDFVYLKELMSLLQGNEIIILNMGDSSTSGWNSNVVTEGANKPNALFFTYKTYSQLIEEKSNCKIINAGVPGYSSLQGKKYLQRLLKEFSKNNILVDYVTIYFGNNDSTYNLHEDKVRLEGKKASLSNNIGFRVSIEDFRKNILEMIEICKDYGTVPILIIPPINYDWKPGIRSEFFKGEFEEALAKLSSSAVKNALLQSIELYKLREYQKAKELDLVLPRIKDAYIQTLKDISKEHRIKVIDVQDKIPLEETSEFFADYCHPLEKVNSMIVKEILKHIKPNDKINVMRGGIREDFDLPDKTYTLY